MLPMDVRLLSVSKKIFQASYRISEHKSAISQSPNPGLKYRAYTPAFGLAASGVSHVASPQQSRASIMEAPTPRALRVTAPAKPLPSSMAALL